MERGASAGHISTRSKTINKKKKKLKTFQQLGKETEKKILIPHEQQIFRQKVRFHVGKLLYKYAQAVANSQDQIAAGFFQIFAPIGHSQRLRRAKTQAANENTAKWNGQRCKQRERTNQCENKKTGRISRAAQFRSSFESFGVITQLCSKVTHSHPLMSSLNRCSLPC